MWQQEQEREQLRQAVEDYSEFGGALNHDLRTGALTPESQPERWASDVEPLDRALRHSPLGTAVDVTRGIDEDALPLGVTLDNLDRIFGRKITEHGYMSVARSPRPPLRFGERPILLRMHLPAGARALDLAQYGSSFVPERELLLPRGARWRPTRVYREERQWVMDCEVET